MPRKTTDAIAAEVAVAVDRLTRLGANLHLRSSG